MRIEEWMLHRIGRLVQLEQRMRLSLLFIMS
jgi:hypothetical protein